MKNLLPLIGVIILLSACRKDVDLPVGSQTTLNLVTKKRIYFTQQGTYINKSFSHTPGDTLVLKQGIDYTYFTMDGVTDVVIVNEGNVHLKNGFNFANCSNVTVAGSFSPNKYGFEISTHTPGDVGIDINGKSRNIKISGVFIHDKTYGFWVKQEVGGTCDQSLYYPNWYIDSVEIFNCKVTSVNQEGMYLGSTGQNADRVNSCGQRPYPLRLSNISVHNNIVDSTGRGGIMLSGADKGSNKIFNNVITRCGFEMNSYQGNGIVIGGNAYADIIENTIKNTLCDGIFVLGIGMTRVKANKIDSSGWLNGVKANNMHGISFDTRPSYPFVLSSFRIRSNVVGKHTDVNDIYIYNTAKYVTGKWVSGFDTEHNLVYNNNEGQAKVTAQQGIVYATEPKN